MYLPKLKREVRISPAMLQDPWMGTDFSNQDLLEADSLLENYDHRIVSQDAATIRIESLPKAGATALWGRLVQTFSSDRLPQQLDYYDQNGRLVRSMGFHDPAMHDGHRIPTLWVMQPAEQPNQRTEILIESISYPEQLDDALFEGGES